VDHPARVREADRLAHAPKEPEHRPQIVLLGPGGRPILGVLSGAALGALDGLSALVSSPEVSDQISGIVLGSSGKGILAGLIVGLVARKMKSSSAGIALGTVVAAVITLPVAYLNATQYGEPSYYWKIMLPGALVGAMVGYSVVRFGRPPAAAPTAAAG
jgi:uncharacterized membrane protein YeaQ/YmgE (transglycosylase-associated protein family)